ncbi:hypothetical protein [Marinilabilia salmonicolor]|jgi:hypothetical protein|uniref:Uncharacterized protein n=1 Tax=Marinilabilia salmonicolor TaxID=989 RepID=A0A2T0WYV0_9BACT|nr:hypothetical protein [Marinilabilia salmonicolor]PRY91861.1 hypothetical protein BY457_1235 [Marinilabilia salmonicolor]RCW34595.1 hypothetical protein DFO77_11196 [Marinilabilia salmonicolor]
MEFLLQLFADIIGTPAEEELVKQANEVVEDKKVEAVSPSEKIKEEDPVLFGLMQFH